MANAKVATGNGPPSLRVLPLGQLLRVLRHVDRREESECEDVPRDALPRVWRLHVPFPFSLLPRRSLTPHVPLGDLPTLIKHGLHALRDTLQQDKDLTPLNTSLGIVGVSSSSSSTSAPKSSEESAPATLGVNVNAFEKFRIVEGDELKPFLDSMDPKESNDDAPAAAPATVATGAAAVPAPADVQPPTAGGDTMDTD